MATSPDNAAIADRLEAFAVLLDLAGAGTYSVRAYRRAADIIRSTPVPVADLVRKGEVRRLSGIGASIEARLRELVETGDIAELAELERETAPELVGGALSGPGERRSPRSLLLTRAWDLVGTIADALGGEAAGDPRRWRDECERLAVVCAAERPAELLDRFAELPQIVAVVEREERRALGVTVEGVPVELVVAPPEQFGTELVRATGSDAFVHALGPLPDAPDEVGVFQELGVPWRPPELREDRSREEPPAGLVALDDVHGDLHCHTTWSDGRASVLEMGQAARDLGYEYLAICDHTRAVRVVPGVDADDLRRQAEEIAAANEQLAPFRVLRGAECDILPDGALDLPDDVLAELDWVQVSLHAGQRAARNALTGRVVEAIRHPAARCLSHPTGRLINRRPPHALDLELVLEVALETGVALEVNGLPDRLDLRDENVRLAVEAGVAIVCSTDAHSVRGLGNMRLSVATARRGEARAADVLNTRPVEEVLSRRR